ncbi:hypothetical protein AVEN_48709-1 [Araneus ventricosus]|uniref:Uncharacterized protein n=1 Tax=Araneus ventricosus TaxID=182803 RepID=A0A4Y2CHI8_ARAVE|nr:hypothetical protein AVEN_48709-1 [Araneus ventricosus]
MLKEEWMSIDEGIPVSATLTDMEIRQAVCEQDQTTSVDDSDGNECPEEYLPKNAKMRQAHDILKRGVQHRPTNKNEKQTNKKKQYEYEQYINELLRNNCRQATINEFCNCYF